MKNTSLLLFLLFISFFVSAQSADELAIKKLMADQTNAWNKGNIDDFMKAYWNDDSLTFIGHGGITYGYNNTLNNYKINYNDSSKMGRLFFTLIKLKKLSPEYYFVTGKWFLKRSAGDIGGYYTLLFRKIKGQWLIITDHTS
jgi:ketosteroid isomerase-like protein